MPDVGADARPNPPWAEGPPPRRPIAVLLLAAAALDSARCGLVMATAHRPAPAAVLIGAALAPQAAAPGFGAPYKIPDRATAGLGVVLAVTVLASVGGTAGYHIENPCAIDKETR